MCCLKIDTETLLANCLNTCKTYSFSPDDLQQIVRLMANATDRYIFSDTGDDALHEIVTKFPDMFVYADEDRIALRSEWQHDDKKLPMAYFDFGYSAALCAFLWLSENIMSKRCMSRISALSLWLWVRTISALRMVSNSWRSSLTAKKPTASLLHSHCSLTITGRRIPTGSRLK